MATIFLDMDGVVADFERDKNHTLFLLKYLE